jgi:TonB family protein
LLGWGATLLFPPTPRPSEDGKPRDMGSFHFSVHAKTVELTAQRALIDHRHQEISGALRSEDLDNTATIPHSSRTIERVAAASEPSMLVLVRSSERMKPTKSLEPTSDLRKGSTADQRDTFKAEPSKATRPRPDPVATREAIAINATQTAPHTEELPASATPKPPQEAKTLSLSGHASASPSKHRTLEASASAYGEKVWAVLRRHKPRVGQKGSAAVTFGIDASGALRHASVIQSSGNARIDRMALQTVRSAAPFPSPPPGLNTEYAVRIYF